MAKKLTYEEFTRRGNTIHNGKYLYDRTDLNDRDEKGRINITCPIHGDFRQDLRSHLKGHGCKYCYHDRATCNRWTNAVFKEKAESIHSDRYDYSETDVNNRNEKGEICIICRIHGKFWQLPSKHLCGHGCHKCAGNEMLNNEIFKKRAREVHGDHYDYSLVNYCGQFAEVQIICNKCGKVFSQIPHNHIYGKQGCSWCRQSKLEEEVCIYLEKHNIEFVREKTFEWLRNKGLLRLDFYLPNYNIAIECQGKQHFGLSDFSGHTSIEQQAMEYRERQENDKMKQLLCEKYGVVLIYLDYNDDRRKEKLIKILEDGRRNKEH